MPEVFVKGLGIGLAIAAPVGPIGILCIRRSLSEGRATGLATGLGAAVADGTYGLLVAVGFTATGVLTRYASQLQLFGGVLIFWMGLMTLGGFFKKRSGIAPAPSASRLSLLGAFGGTYLLTLSNPATIIAFTGMIAALGTAASAGGNAAYILVSGVFLGSALWWTILVHLAVLARDRIASGALRWLDLVAGSILLMWGGWIAAVALTG